MPSQPTWQVVPGSSFRWRQWDEEHVLYHENSGDTHRLNALGARALELLETPATADELARRLAARLTVAPDEAFASVVGKLVLHFRELGLVESVTVHDARQPHAE